ncbi:hypothetical protein BDZ89DRAFT_1081322 [Hymenopellis radicata]|nr:hypothetical protein BDZ89DRAFT_1081322 [Hymenopellis radicata]
MSRKKGSKNRNGPPDPAYTYHRAVDGSPNRHVVYLEALTQDAKDAVIAASPLRDVCLFCHKSNNNGRTTCSVHIIDKALSEEEIITLQYNWGMTNDKLFLHSRYNVAIGCYICHNWLDTDLIAAFPLTQTIGKMEKFTKLRMRNKQKKHALKYIKNGPVHQCRMVFLEPHQESFTRFSLHQNADGSYFNGPNAQSQEFPAPFATDRLSLEVIETHINPFFLTWNAGLKLSNMTFDQISALPGSLSRDAFRILKLFKAWTSTTEVPQKLLPPFPPDRRKQRDESPCAVAAVRKRHKDKEAASSKSAVSSKAKSRR